MVSRDGPLRSFGRIKARPLKPRQGALLELRLPALALPAEGPILPGALFPGAEGFVLEIGFGGGEHLVAEAAAAPGLGFIGVEPFLNGVASCVRHIEEAGLGNVRLHMGDAREIIARLPDGALERVDILFPDPWPKARHWKRRLIQPDLVQALARILRPEGEVRFATDWAAYAEWTVEIFAGAASFGIIADPQGPERPWQGHSPTRYELKRLGDIAPVFYRFRLG